MANTKPSLFSTLKVFRFTGSKPPPPPPKDPNYLYPSSKNPSVVSFSHQSTHHQHPATGPKSAPQSPKSSRYGSGARSIRSPSPTPSRAMQPSPQQQNRPPLFLQRQQSPPPASTSASTLSPETALGSGKKGFFRKMSGLRKRSASKSSRMTTVEDAADDESISHPWNFQHHIHIDESFQGIPSTWSSTLADLGYSEAEIALIQKGRRNDTPDLPSVQDASRSTTPARDQSPTSTYSVNPPVRSSSLRRQRSDGSIARSERSARAGPPPPPPPLPLPLPPPPAPQQPQAPSPSHAAPVAPPPTPASDGSTSGENNNADGLTTPSGAQYIYVSHQRRTANGLMAVPQPAPVPIIQPVPPRPMRSRSNSVATTARSPPSRSASVSSSSGRERRFRAPPTGPFRVVNGASPPPAYSDDLERGGSPPPISLDDAARPWPQEKVGSSPSMRPLPTPGPAPAPRDRIKTPPPDPPRVDGSPRGAAAEQMNAPGRGLEETRDEQEEQGRASHDSARSSSERRRPRPSDLSILPPRISLRKDTLDDLSSWSASLFSSLPSALHDSPQPSASTAATSAESTKPDVGKHRTKPSVTLPTIVLHPEVREENEDEEGENEEEEEVAEQDYSYSASPLYHELMGMMQARAAPTTNGAGSPGPGSPASADFQPDTASSSSHGASSRDSQLTIRFNPRRDSSRDSSASTSTLTHATIVRGASIVRRVRADVVTTPPAFARLKGKEREQEQEQAPIVVLEDDDVGDDNDDSSSDASGSDEDGGSGSPVGTLALTSGPNSQEDAGGCRSPRLASPASSPLRATFPEPESEEPEQTQNEETTQKSLVQDAYVTPPPSAPPVSVDWPPTAIGTIDLEKNPNGVLPSLLSSASSEPAKELENGAMPPRFTSTGAATPRYPSWLAAIVLPLAEFIDDSADPHALFTDLQEIAQGESGSVYSARAAPVVAPQFRPPTPRSPASGSSSPSSPSDDESGVSQQKPTMVAIKRVPLVRDTTTGLTDMRRELELARALRHANVLRMERLYVDVVEESLWIGMELMDRSLADVLAVVGEEVGVEDGSDGGENGGSGGAGVVEISEKMVARFVWDVLLALSFIRKHQIAHRDVRSDNLLLSKSGVLKLSDFSTAVRSPPGTPKRSDSVGVIYWQAPEMRTGLYDPLKVDVWSLGATTWELVHGDPPFGDVQDTRQIVGAQLPPVRQPEAFSRSFHDFLLLCSQPAATRPDPDELLNTHFIRTACPRSEVVRLLGQCRTIDEHQLRRPSCDSDF